MRVVKIENGERITTVALTDREILHIYAALLETDYKTEANNKANSELWTEFSELTRDYDLSVEGRALYHDAT